MWKSLKNYYFKNIVHSSIIFCVCIAPVQVHNWAKYEGSKLNHAVRRATWRIELQWLPFKKYRLYSLIHVHILGAYVHICAKYEVSVIKPVDGRTVHRQWQWQQQRRQWRHTTDNSWLYRLIGMTAIWANNNRQWVAKVASDWLSLVQSEKIMVWSDWFENLFRTLIFVSFKAGSTALYISPDVT